MSNLPDFPVDIRELSSEEAFLRGQIVGASNVVAQLAYRAPLEVEVAQMLTGALDSEVKRIGEVLGRWREGQR